MFTNIYRASVAAWKFLILPSLKCLTVGGLFLAAWATIMSFQLLFLPSLFVCDHCNDRVLDVVIIIDPLLIYVSGFFFQVEFFEKRVGGDVPNFEKFVETGLREIAPKAGEGAISLSTENTPGSLSLVDRGALSLHTKDLA